MESEKDLANLRWNSAICFSKESKVIFDNLLRTASLELPFFYTNKLGTIHPTQTHRADKTLLWRIRAKYVRDLLLRAPMMWSCPGNSSCLVHEYSGIVLSKGHCLTPPPTPPPAFWLLQSPCPNSTVVLELWGETCNIDIPLVAAYFKFTYYLPKGIISWVLEAMDVDIQV